VLRFEGERVFEVAASCCALTGLRVEDAEVAPAIGISLVDVERGLLFADRPGEIATRGEQLRQERMAGWVAGIGCDGGA
jgi:hypothetical protein